MREFLTEFKVGGHRGLSDALFANSFVKVRPATTPSGLAPQHSNANADPILKALAAVKNRLAAAGIALDAKLGDIQYVRSEEHTSELQSRPHLVCRLLLEK